MTAETGRIDEATLRDLIEPVGDLDELDQACFHKGDDRWRQVGDEGWDHLFERTLVYLRTQLGYFFDYNIAEGNFGRLVRMYDPENRADVTVCFSAVVNARRENLWRTLSHPNLMELLRRIRHACSRRRKRSRRNARSAFNNRGRSDTKEERAVLGGLASLQPCRVVSPRDVRLDSVFAPPDVIAARIGLEAPSELQADRVDAWSFSTLVAEALTCHWRWKVRKFLVLSKSRERSTAERLSLLSEYVRSRFQSSACLRRYLHQHFRAARIDDDEAAALAGLLAWASGRTRPPGARWPPCGPTSTGTPRPRRPHAVWACVHVSRVFFRGALSAPAEDEVESSLGNTTTCTWDASSRELAYGRVDEEQDSDEQGAQTHHRPDEAGPVAMMLLPHGPPPKLAGSQLPGSLAARTRRWLAGLLHRQPPHRLG
ncbi:hypothetical protein HPB48_012353 [Haemaphysalis longicornis]|uniref:Uncharacterized protein n=1 Tax=Haemaphysalis longicornis TaxID=44386 RepID=A0A9J6G1T6_HAELO|nr:hypothetical protein HPB48_012353 [Haemaphysalis longicornis]